MSAAAPERPRDRVGRGVIAAIHASQHQFVAVVAATTVPALSVLVLLEGLGLPPTFGAAIGWAGLMLPTSLFLHELGHAVSAALISAGSISTRTRRIRGVGSWRTSAIVRPSLGLAGDALVALAGPLAGLACALPVALAADTFLMGALWLSPFLVHLVSLLPTGTDGSQVLCFLLREVTHARR